MLLLDRPLSQRGNIIETVVQAIILEGLVLEVLFVITAISLTMRYAIVRNDRIEIINFSLLISLLLLRHSISQFSSQPRN